MTPARAHSSWVSGLPGSPRKGAELRGKFLRHRASGDELPEVVNEHAGLVPRTEVHESARDDACRDRPVGFERA